MSTTNEHISSWQFSCFYQVFKIFTAFLLSVQICGHVHTATSLRELRGQPVGHGSRFGHRGPQDEPRVIMCGVKCHYPLSRKEFP